MYQCCALVINHTHTPAPLPASLPQRAARTQSAIFSTWFSSPCSHNQTVAAVSTLRGCSAFTVAASRWSRFLGLPPELDCNGVLGKGACLLLDLCPVQLLVMSGLPASPGAQALQAKGLDLQLLSQQAELRGCAWHLSDTSVTTS